MDDLTIHIYASDEGGYKYDIWTTDPENALDTDSVDGGHCTTTMLNALGMANDQAAHIITLNKQESIEERPTPCNECGGKVLSVFERINGCTMLASEACENQCYNP